MEGDTAAKGWLRLGLTAECECAGSGGGDSCRSDMCAVESVGMEMRVRKQGDMSLVEQNDEIESPREIMFYSPRTH